MKKLTLLITILIVVLSAEFIQAQAPNKINYQAVIRNEDGSVVADQEVRMEIQLIRDFDDGPIDYLEEHVVTTNQFGLVHFQIGNGIPMLGNMLNIVWGEHPYFIHLAVDITGGIDFVNLGSSELLSVPYALHAQTATEVAGAGDNQFLNLDGNILTIENGNSVDLASLVGTSGNDSDSTNELQTLDLMDNMLSISNGNSVDLSDLVGSSVDADSTNELQELSITNDQLSISNGNTVTIPTGTAVWMENQDSIYYEGEITQLKSVTGGNRIVFRHGNVVGATYHNPSQSISSTVSPNAISIGETDVENAIIEGSSNGGTISLLEDGDIRIEMGNDDDGGVISNYNNDGTQIIRQDGRDNGAGAIRVFGPNGNANVEIRTTSNPNEGRLSIGNANGEELVALTASVGGAGYVASVGPNSSENVVMTSLATDENKGFLAIVDELDATKAGAFVNASGQGVIFGDVKNFVMDHPTEHDKKIVYASLEGPEAAAYVRGTNMLNNGEIFVAFPEHFQHVINASSMTIMLTPLSADSKGLAVISKSELGFTVKELANGFGNYSFDWEVKGVRKGFENYLPVRDANYFKATTEMK